MMASDDAFEQSVEHLSVLDFTDTRMRLLFELMTKLRDIGRATDVVTLAAACSKSKRWVETGLDDPVTFIGALYELSQDFHAAKDYIRIVKAASVGRQLMSYCTEVVGLIQDADLSGDEMLAQAAQLLPNVESSAGVVTYRDAAQGALEAIQRRMKGEVLGITTGLPSLDDLIMGWEPGTLNILGGRPSHGKSLYGMDFAHAASKHGAVQVYSLEMTAANLAMRGISSLGGVDYGSMREGKLDDHMQGNMAFALTQIKKMNIYIDDRGGLTVDQLRARARALARKDQPALIVCDYLQLLTGSGNNRNEQVGYVSRSLKAMAKELNVPVLCLAQVNRAVESRPDHRPMSSDLRDSGEIEQDADIIMFTYLAEKYDDDTPRKGIGELIVRKQRNGPTGSVFTEFQGVYQRFREYKGIVPPEKSEPEKTGRGMSSFVAANDKQGF